MTPNDMDPATRAAFDRAIAEAKADVAERVRGGPRLLHPADPRVAKNRAALKAAMPSPDEMIIIARGEVKS